MTARENNSSWQTLWELSRITHNNSHQQPPQGKGQGITIHCMKKRNKKTTALEDMNAQSNAHKRSETEN